ncbi:hypothetical protein P171DRAFT_506920 [Karstenula rhodostoma CBS 690.94]|uniref:Uncharacterized protein n=1 Tax=Karstenula rhodostoma CBS 690.94 TaxID=1392251 RepID=A0A9P4UHK0_9PLEO|nr:hypothetical protein P171DRAFT_506920 [Karstenula rhodostoma CBS 690.94]
MASKQSVAVLPPTANPNLFPSPLHIRKKARRASRRATFYRRIVRKSPHQPRNEACDGPLDDIITQISSDIWASPSEWNLEATLHGLAEPLEDFFNAYNPLKVASTCTISTVMPLPVSRIPSDQPLTIRKSRSSRSTASESSASHSSMAFSRSSSGNEPADSSKVRASFDAPPAPWPQVDAESEPTSSNNTICPAHTPAQQALEEVQHAGEPKLTKRRSSRARLFPNGFTRLLRSSSDAKATELPTHAEDCNDDGIDNAELLRTEAANSDTSISSMIKQVARGLPSPLENRHDVDAIETHEAPQMPATLKTTINVLSEVKVLGSDQSQEFWASVEIKGVLHNRRELVDSSIDVVFVIDNGYYVSKDSLTRALEAATGGLHQLDRGDRVALYTTHCTHGSVASTVPDKLLPLRPVCSGTEEIFRDLTLDIEQYGTQAWNPPRPTPSMSNVILAIAKSLEKETPKHERCHVILLSPAFDVLHTVSDTFPSIHIHQINPAVLPFIPNEEHREMVCHETCCKNVFVSNWTHYQSVPGRIKQIILQARSKGPVGSIKDIHVDLRPKSGCEVLEIDGPTTMSVLRSGQAFCFFAHLRVTPPQTQQLCGSCKDPLLQHSLDATNLRQELYAAEKLDAKLAHLLSVQVFYRSTFSPPGTWSYTEAPLVAVAKLGRLAPPHDFSLDVFKRHAFHVLNKFDNETPKKRVENLAMGIPDEREDMKQVIHCMAKEIHWHQAVLEYEASSRQKLPSCIAPIGEELVIFSD